MNKNIDALACQWIEENKESVISDWMELCRIPSVVSDPVGDAPFGLPAKEALCFVDGLYKKYGLNSRNEDNYYLISEYGSGDKRIGVFGHADVVPGGDGWIYTKPFEPVIIKNTLIGRGVEDNKAGVIASLVAVRILRDMNIPLGSVVQGFVGSAEEVGMEDISAFLEREIMPDFSLVPDASFPCCIGEKGIFRIFARCRDGFTAIKEFKGGECINAVTDKTVARIDFSTALYDEMLSRGEVERITVERDGDFILVTAKGISAHASTPESSINASYLLSGFLGGLEALPEGDRSIMKTVNHLLSDTTGEVLGIAFSDDIFGALTAANGMAFCKDGHLNLTFDVRYGKDHDGAWVEENISKSLDFYGFDTYDGDDMRAIYLDPKSEMAIGLTSIYREISECPEAKPFCMGGKTYASMLKNATAIGTFVDKERDEPEMPAGHGGVHSPDEKISIDGFFEAVRVLVQYIVFIDKQLNK
ncbi:MAG: M20 family metallopeptidase [Ruminococcaceae bacterium]|nr:M20 family metallopeptidase [Oscillospiraceae bacterium]